MMQSLAESGDVRPEFRRDRGPSTRGKSRAPQRRPLPLADCQDRDPGPRGRSADLCRHYAHLRYLTLGGVTALRSVFATPTPLGASFLHYES
jgi:hypothetical protein